MDIFLQNMGNFIQNPAFTVLFLIVYILLHQLQRRIETHQTKANRSDEFLILKTKNEIILEIDKKEDAKDEVIRYATSRFKSLNRTFQAKSKTLDKVTNLAIKGVLLNGFLKAEIVLFHRLNHNGYHELSISDLENYIQFSSNEFYDSLVDYCCSDEIKDTIDLSEFIERDKIVSCIRNIIEVSIGIFSR